MFTFWIWLTVFLTVIFWEYSHISLFSLEILYLVGWNQTRIGRVKGNIWNYLFWGEVKLVFMPFPTSRLLFRKRLRMRSCRFCIQKTRIAVFEKGIFYKTVTKVTFTLEGDIFWVQIWAENSRNRTLFSPRNENLFEKNIMILAGF